MDQTNHIKSVHEAYIKEFCRVYGMRTRIVEDKRLNATIRQCASHETILNLVHIDISKDEAIHSSS